MNRTTFGKILGAGTFGAALPGSPAAAKEQTARARVAAKWPEKVFRRFSVDMHIPDWDPELLSRFDAAKYVGLVARGGFQSLMQMCNSHTGICIWPTQIGKPHANLKGRDFVAEIVRECRRQGVVPLGYFSVIYDNWAFETHPDWRLLSADGYRQLEGRYGTVCPNSPYREYVLACVRELVSSYDFDGIFFDMTFWPGICYCPHCTARFRDEHKAEPPRVVDWDDPTWRAFHQARERWLSEFAQAVTATVKQTRSITVSHQYSTIFHNWTLGTPLELTEATDYAIGDFYGGAAQHSLACKTYTGLTRTRPFELATSRTKNFREHVSIKTKDEIRIESFVPYIHSGSLLLIDYFNPDGTLNPNVYDFLGQVTKELTAYEPFLGGELMADVAIYFDKESLYNPDENRVHVTKLLAVDKCPHRDAVVGAARALKEAHIPFGVVTNANLRDLEKYRAVLLPNVLELTQEQAQKFRQFVESGGILYASGPSSLDRRAAGGPRYLLEEVLGVRYKGKQGTIITYLTPREEELGKVIWPQDHLSHLGPMVQAEPLAGTEVLATVTLPFVEPGLGRAVGSRFAAIHSNPPATRPGTDPAVVVHRFGQGRAVWLAAPIETSLESVNQKLLVWLLKRVLPGPYRFEVETHPSVEMTLFHQTEKNRLLVGLLSMPEHLPPIPVEAVVRVLLPEGRFAKRVLMLPEQKSVPFRKAGAQIEFTVQPFDVIAMALVEYG